MSGEKQQDILIPGMRPTQFPESNHSFFPPPELAAAAGMTQTALELPVFVGPGPSGDTQIISCWQLNDKDMETILDTRRIWVAIHGLVQPPISVMTEYPFESPRENLFPADGSIEEKQS